MSKAGWIIAVMLLVAGCRGVAPPGDRGIEAVVTAPEPQNRRQTAAFVQASHVAEPSVTASPEPSDVPLTLADFEVIAFQNNPVLAAAAAQIDAARGRHVQAGLFPNPVGGYHATEIGNEGTAGQQGGFVSQRFITAGKLRLDQAMAAKEIDEAQFRFRAQQQRVLSDVRVRFYDALVAQRREELTKDLARIGDELVAATKKLGRRASPNDLLQAEIRADEAYILLDNARNNLVEAWRRLVAVAGTPDMHVAALGGSLDADLPCLDWGSCYAMALGGNPELHAARARAERAGIAIVRAKREPVPNVDLSVSVRHHNVTGSDVANVQLGVPIPIFDRNQGNLAAARADWSAAAAEVKRIELDLQDRLAVAFRRYANARQQAERYRQRILPRAEKSLELVTDGYEKGLVEYLLLLTAQQTYVQTNLSYLDSLRELRASAAAIQGQLLTGSLKAER